MPKVSVCIPIYNVEKYIEKCARSLFEQTLDDIEYIFINDCTPDRSVEILRTILEEYPHREAQTRIINHTTNQGLAAARNTGLKAAIGEYIICCDSDDWVDKCMYKDMYDKARAENADIVCCNTAVEYATSREELIYPYLIETPADLIYIDVVYCAVWNKLIRRDLYQLHNITWYNGINMWEDVGLITRLRYFSRKTVIIPHIYYHYNKLNTQSIVSSQSVNKVYEQIQCAKLLETFFREEGIINNTRYHIILSYIKFKSKLPLIWDYNMRNICEWQRIYPESSKYIWRYSPLSYTMRMTLWLASIGFTCFACKLIDWNSRRRSRNSKR